MCKIYDGLVGRTVTRFTDLAIFVEQLFRRRLGRYSSPATRAASTHSLMSALVKSRHLRCKKSCPLYPRKRTFAAHLGMSAKGKKRPRKNIGHAARRRRHDQRNRLVGIVLTMGAPEAMLNQTAAAARIAISSLHPPASPQKKRGALERSWAEVNRSLGYFEYAVRPFFRSYVSANHRDGAPRSASTWRRCAML
jgi:hypothetical protein